MRGDVCVVSSISSPSSSSYIILDNADDDDDDDDETDESDDSAAGIVNGEDSLIALEFLFFRLVALRDVPVVLTLEQQLSLSASVIQPRNEECS